MAKFDITTLSIASSLSEAPPVCARRSFSCSPKCSLRQKVNSICCCVETHFGEPSFKMTGKLTLNQLPLDDAFPRLPSLCRESPTNPVPPTKSRSRQRCRGAPLSFSMCISRCSNPGPDSMANNKDHTLSAGVELLVDNFGFDGKQTIGHCLGDSTSIAVHVPRNVGPVAVCIANFTPHVEGTCLNWFATGHKPFLLVGSDKWVQNERIGDVHVGSVAGNCVLPAQKAWFQIPDNHSSEQTRVFV